MEDREILQLYNARNEQAIRETQIKYGDYCTAISLDILQDRLDAEECVNDTYLRAWNTIPPKQPSVLRTYLGKLTRNLSIDRLRARNCAKRSGELTVAMDELAYCLADTEAVSDQGLCEMLDAFLDGLPPVERKLFVGRYWYGYSVARLAKSLGMKPNTVTKQLGRTREKLRAHLAERGFRL